MGLFQTIFGKQKKLLLSQWKTFTAYDPVFTNWNGAIYESMLVRIAIHAIATHISKLDVTITGTAKPTLTTQLSHAPNKYTTWSQFFYRAATILEAQNTVFFVPVSDEFGRPKGIYTVVPRQCEVKAFNDTPYLRYEFSSGEWAAIELSRVGMMTKFQYENDYFGESNEVLRQTMQIIHLQDQSIEEATKQGAFFRFMAKLDNFIRDEDLKKEREKFTEENLQTGNSGMLLFPSNYTDIKQIESKPFVIDADQRKLIQENVFNYFGVNEKVIRNECYGDAWNAFYEGKISPFANQFSQVTSKMFYTEIEQTNGSAIIATDNKMQYMSNKDRLNYAAEMGDRGFVTRNEIRVNILQLPPLPPEIGDTLPVRGEYYNLGEEKKKKNGTRKKDDKKDENDEDAGNDEDTENEES